MPGRSPLVSSFLAPASNLGINTSTQAKNPDGPMATMQNPSQGLFTVSVIPSSDLPYSQRDGVISKLTTMGVQTPTKVWATCPCINAWILPPALLSFFSNVPCCFSGQCPSCRKPMRT